MKERIKALAARLREAMKSNQILSTGGDGCNVVQAIRDGLGHAWTSETNSFLAGVINSKDSVYDELDRIADGIEELEEETLVVKIRRKGEALDWYATSVCVEEAISHKFGIEVDCGIDAREDLS